MAPMLFFSSESCDDWSDTRTFEETDQVQRRRKKGDDSMEKKSQDSQKNTFDPPSSDDDIRWKKESFSFSN